MISIVTDDTTLLLDVTLPVELKNHNDGQGHSFWRTDKQRKDFEKALSNYRRKPFGRRVVVVVTRILGPKQRFFDASSILRGNYKQLEDALTALGWWPDDSYTHISFVGGLQDGNRRSEGPATRIQIYDDGPTSQKRSSRTATTPEDETVAHHRRAVPRRSVKRQPKTRT